MKTNTRNVFLALAATTGTLCLIVRGWAAIVMYNGSTVAWSDNSTNGHVPWAIGAAGGYPIVLRVGKTSGTSSFVPRLRLYDSSGSNVLAETTSPSASELVFIGLTNAGYFARVDSSITNSPYTGTYLLSFVTPCIGSDRFTDGSYYGRRMTNGLPASGTINVGMLDAWTFTACLGDGINLQLNELTGGSTFTPSMRLYSPDGSLLGAASGDTTAQLNTIAPKQGYYTLVIADASPGLAGTGTYQLTGNGLSSSLRLCSPTFDGTNLVLRGVGGVVTSNYILLTATNASQASNSWSTVNTSQFGTFGDFTATNQINPAEPTKFFRVKTP